MAEVAFNEDPNAGNPSLQDQAAALDKAAADRAAAAAAADAGRPDWLPPQFKTLDDYVKSATDTRAELTRVQQELAELKKGQKPDNANGTEGQPKEQTPPQTPTDQSEADKAAKEAVDKAGVDVSEFTAEFNETGDVSEENRAKLAEALKGQFGENARALVDQYIEGSKATVANARNAALTEVGGEQAYAEIVTWAKNGGMTKAEIEAFNKAVEGDTNSVLLAMRGIKASYEKANGRVPNLVKGDGITTNSGPQPFRSATEQNKAIQDPRYKSDPAYRNDVVQRMLISKF